MRSVWKQSQVQSLVDAITAAGGIEYLQKFTCASRWSFGAGAFEGGPVSVITGMENHNRMLGDQIRTELL